MINIYANILFYFRDIFSSTGVMEINITFLCGLFGESLLEFDIV